MFQVENTVRINVGKMEQDKIQEYSQDSFRSLYRRRQWDSSGGRVLMSSRGKSIKAHKRTETLGLTLKAKETLGSIFSKRGYHM